jgi:hypothetical protein
MSRYPHTKAEKLEYGMYLQAKAQAMVVPRPYPDGLGSWAVMKRRDDMLAEARRLIAAAIGGKGR